MEKIRKLENVTFTASLLLIILFTYAAFSKLLARNIFTFQMQLAPVHLVNELAPFLSWFVPFIELLIVVLLCYERYRLAGLYCSFCLLLSFNIYITAMLLSGLDLPCTCGGIISHMGWKMHLLFNAGFMIIAVIPMVMHRKMKRHIGNEYPACPYEGI